MDWRERRPATSTTVTLVVTAVVLVAAMALALRGSGTSGTSDRVGLAAGTGVTVSCPSVEAALEGVDIPAAAQAGVDAELANLERQIANVDARLAREPDQAASQAGDIAGKRNAVIERIILNIERVGGEAPDDLGDLAECAVVGADDAGAGAGVDGEAAPPADDAGAGEGDGEGDGAAGGAQTVSCPDVEGELPAVPASAAAEVERNLALLQRQIDEADARLADLAVNPQGGPNFIRNAILGPLEDKRTATIDRIAIAIGRTADRPTNLGGLAACELAAGGGAADPGAGAGAGDGAADGDGDGAGAGAGAGDGGGAAEGAQTVNCPEVEGELPAVPASAAAEVERNLALLDTQIAEANARLARLAVNPEGGPNFVQNAIVGPLEDKRFATLNRIATAIGRTAERPSNLADLAPCTVTG
jgi:hypothetical protein